MTNSSPPAPDAQPPAGDSNSKNSDAKTPVEDLLKPVSILDAKVSDFVNWFQNVSLVKLATVLSESAILFAVISYVVTIPYRQQQTVQEARRTLVQVAALPYNKARITALQVLNRHCADNPGLEAPHANLKGLTLSHCHRWSLGLKNWGQWPPTLRTVVPINLAFSNLSGVNLSEAQLAGINLAGSDLRGANLQNANLKNANLSNADLTGANLSRINLTGANLEGAVLDRAHLDGANLQGVNFYRASLVNARLLWTDLQRTNFYRANLEGANFNRSNLQQADLYKANLRNAALRFVNLQGDTNLRGAELTGANLWGTQFSSVSQLKRAENWQQAFLSPNWEKQVELAQLPRLRIGLIKPADKQHIFEAYEIGMRRAANRRVEVWGFESEAGVDNEAKTIRELIDYGMDAIILIPVDSVDSIAAIQAARDAGIVVVTIDACFEPQQAENLVVACYDTDNYHMGVQSGQALIQWSVQNLRARPLRSKLDHLQPLKLGIVDGADYDRYYPYLQGFLAGVEASKVPWEEVSSVGVREPSDRAQVVEMLEQHPDLEVLWSGSNLATEVTLQALEQLQINDIPVFGILDLSPENAQQLLDPDSPLQMIVHQSGIEIGYEAVTTAIDVLRGPRPSPPYQIFSAQHQSLTPADEAKIRQLLPEVESIQ